jgi:hypothetical protein
MALVVVVVVVLEAVFAFVVAGCIPRVSSPLSNWLIYLISISWLLSISKSWKMDFISNMFDEFEA